MSDLNSMLPCPSIRMKVHEFHIRLLVSGQNQSDWQIYYKKINRLIFDPREYRRRRLFALKKAHTAKIMVLYRKLVGVYIREYGGYTVSNNLPHVLKEIMVKYCLCAAGGYTRRGKRPEELYIYRNGKRCNTMSVKRYLSDYKEKHPEWKY